MLSPEKVKPFILHNEGVIRTFAVRYFADSNMGGADIDNVMPLVLQGCDMYPEQEKDNRLALSYAKLLPQTAETIKTIIDTLKANKVINLWYEAIITHADPSLLLPFLEEIYSLVSKEAKELIIQRQQISNKSTEELWEELLDFGDRAAGKYVSEFNYHYGEYLAWELVKREDLSSQKIMEQFQSYDIESYGGYTTIYLAMMIGERGIKEAIPMLIELLDSEGDLENEVAVKALIKIGIPEVVQLIKERFSKEDFSFKLYASEVLAKIKCRESEETILNLLKEENDDIAITTLLADGLCSLLSVDGIPLVQKYINDGYYDDTMLSLEEELYVTCIIAGVSLPELADWKKEIEAGEKRIELLDESDVFDFFGEPMVINQPVVCEPKIGRNDLCPCGSGKKYKKCCGK